MAPRTKRTLQQIFNLVIEAGCYPTRSIYMCSAVNIALDARLINAEEAARAHQAIRTYMKALNPTGFARTLGLALVHAAERGGTIDGDFRKVLKAARIIALEAYSDWRRKPRNPVAIARRLRILMEAKDD